MNGYTSQPSHTYGTRQIMGAFWDVQKSKAERNQAITEVLINQGLAGRLANFEEGTPVYRGLENQYGRQFAQGLVQQNKAIQQNRQFESTINQVNLGNQFLETATRLHEKFGDKAEPTIKKFYDRASKAYKAAGFDADISHLYTPEQNRQNVKDAEIERLEQGLRQLNAKSSPQDFNNAMRAIGAARGMPIFKSKEDQKMFDTWEKLVTDTRKESQDLKTSYAPTKDQKEFVEFLRNNPEYKGRINILDWKQMSKEVEIDLDSVSISIASKNLLVQTGQKDLHTEALKIKQALLKLKGKESPDAPQLTEDLIQHYMKEYNLTREQIEGYYNRRYGNPARTNQ